MLQAFLAHGANLQAKNYRIRSLLIPKGGMVYIVYVVTLHTLLRSIIARYWLVEIDIELPRLDSSDERYRILLLRHRYAIPSNLSHGNRWAATSESRQPLKELFAAVNDLEAWIEAGHARGEAELSGEPGSRGIRTSLMTTIDGRRSMNGCFTRCKRRMSVQKILKTVYHGSAYLDGK
jgi:hypothetical protein